MFLEDKSEDEVSGWLLSNDEPVVFGYSDDMEILALSYVVLPHDG